MKFLITFAAALGLLLAAPARAADHESTKGAHEALEAQAEAPKTPPILPDEASMRAQWVRQHIAHHKNGAEERAENSHGKNGTEERAESESGEVDSEAARHAASDTDSDAANKSTTQGAAAGAARSADSDDHAAAGQGRDIQERGGNPPGSGPGGHGHQPNPNPNPGH